MVFDRDGKYLNAWGVGAITDPHGMTIADGIVYITDRADSVAVTFTLDGKPLQVIGKRGVPSDTGCEKPGDLVPRAAGPFNYPSELALSPSGDLYVSDGYRNSRGCIGLRATASSSTPGASQARPHPAISTCRTAFWSLRMGRSTSATGPTGACRFPLPTGELVSMWTGMGGPNDIARDKDGVFYICEQEADGAPPFVSIRESDGAVLARWEIRHAHGLWVDSRGDIDLRLTTEHSVDKCACGVTDCRPLADSAIGERTRTTDRPIAVTQSAGVVMYG